MTKRDIELSKTQIKLALLELTNEPESKQMWSQDIFCLLYTSPSPRDRQKSRMPSSA